MCEIQKSELKRSRDGEEGTEVPEIKRACKEIIIPPLRKLKAKDVKRIMEEINNMDELGSYYEQYPFRMSFDAFTHLLSGCDCDGSSFDHVHSALMEDCEKMNKQALVCNEGRDDIQHCDRFFECQHCSGVIMYKDADNLPWDYHCPYCKELLLEDDGFLLYLQDEEKYDLMYCGKCGAKINTEGDFLEPGEFFCEKDEDGDTKHVSLNGDEYDEL